MTPQPLSPEQLEQQAQQAIQDDRPEQAERLMRALLAGGSGLIRQWVLLVNALRRQGKMTEAKSIQEMLVDNSPGSLDLRFDLAEILLQLGEFDRGWREYHHRYGLAHTISLERKVPKPRWDGRPIAGKTLLIHDEQGYGDTFQFLRMVPWAKAKSGARILLQILDQQEGFARRMEGIDEIVLRGQLPPPFDMHCEMMSLPKAMSLRLEDLPGSSGYLSPDPTRLAKWRARLAPLPRPIVALVWAGRPTHNNDANRSTSLGSFAPLAQVTGGSFLSIQKGPRAAEAKTPPPGLSILSLDDEIADFEDTAAILAIADLLISVDSSPVHLAGGMGRPVWTLLPYVGEWRWLMDREDSPWYPSMRLFRQRQPGDWNEVMSRVVEALKSFPTNAP